MRDYVAKPGRSHLLNDTTNSMTPQIATILLSLMIASISGGMALFSEGSRKRRYGILITTGFALLSIALSLEILLRNNYISSERKSLSKDWLLLSEEPVEGIEFEIVALNSSVEYQDTVAYLSGISLEINSEAISFLPQKVTGNQLLLADAFTIEDLEEYGRIGSSMARLKVDNSSDPGEIVEFVEFYPIASSRTTKEWLEKFPERQDRTFSAMTVHFPIEAEELTLNSLKEIDHITLEVDPSSTLEYLGGEEAEIVISIRLVAYAPNELLPTMLEISPQHYAKQGREKDGAIEYKFRQCPVKHCKKL